MSDQPLEDRVLEYFRQAAVRMQDLPIYNPQLQVDVLGWQNLDECARGEQTGEAGVLVTPWCMNMIWLPPIDGRPDDWELGGKVTLELVSGDYELVVGEADGVGEYASLSLFSPMAEFADQAAAEETAKEVARLLFAPPAVQAQTEDVPAHPEDEPVNPARRGFFRALSGQRRAP